MPLPRSQGSQDGVGMFNLRTGAKEMTIYISPQALEWVKRGLGSEMVEKMVEAKQIAVTEPINA